MKKLLLFLLLMPFYALAAPPAGCENEGGIQSRNDIVLCESWESTTWYLTSGYYQDGEKTSPTAADATDVTDTSIIKSGCIAGKCLKVRCRAATDGGCSGMLSIWRALSGSLTEAYARYYIRFSPNWNTTNYGNCTPPCTPTEVDNGGKWPGFGDVRTNADPSGQCGNGGNYSDGINCWSGRLKYRNCLGSGGADICTAEGGGSEKTRLGWYWYLPPNTGATNQSLGPFDNQTWGVDSTAACSTSSSDLGATGVDATSCGKGAAGLKNGKWYRVELYVKMNTAGSSDGEARAWINGTLKYEKTNVKYRETGHDNLHVRGFWLDVHMGGEAVGPLKESYIVIDQLVVATGSRVQGWTP
jgi:hypothetical protein